MEEWIKVGQRFVHLATVCEVQLDEHASTARILYAGGGITLLHDDEARDLRDMLLRHATVPDEPHRTVFVPGLE